MQYLPETPKEILKLPRAYLGNVLYTVVGDPFKRWVKEQMEARNKKVTEKGDMIVNMDPEIAAIFRASTSVSVSKGTSNNLMKASAKRRRSRVQVAEDKLLEKRQKQDLDEKIKQLTEMKEENERLRGFQDAAKSKHKEVQHLIDSNVLLFDGEGTIKVNALHP